ncbi:MAG: L-aspartate oxidase [Fibrobacterota bacterium]
MNQISCEYIIIGSGIAGLSYALKTAEAGKTVIITKKRQKDSNSNYAQGGIASVLSGTDSFQKHIKDTLEAGDGLCNPRVVESVVKKGPEVIDKLLKSGVDFTRHKNGILDLGREGGHTENRIAHVKDYTGHEIEKALLCRANKHKNIKILTDHTAVELITNHHCKKEKDRGDQSLVCFGVYVYDKSGKNVIKINAPSTLLATGGAGRTYFHTTNPSIACGDGIAMAFRAGATISNLEFMQFHPTTLYHPDARSFLISEALRGYGAELRDLNGNKFMKKYHKLGSLAPRDVVARAIDKEMKLQGIKFVYLDATGKEAEKTRKRFPNIYKNCLKFGINITREPIPVVPAAHYMCGGIKTDINGRTSIKRLYAAGECACTGLHGANRLASNSLLEAVVMAENASENAISMLNGDFSPPELKEWNDKGTVDNEEWVLLSHDLTEIQRLMWDYVGIVRSDHRLKLALKRISLIRTDIEFFYKKTKITPELLELRNIALTAELIIKCALKRKESRGLHYTLDHPGKYKKIRNTYL